MLISVCVTSSAHRITRVVAKSLGHLGKSRIVAKGVSAGPCATMIASCTMRCTLAVRSIWLAAPTEWPRLATTATAADPPSLTESCSHASRLFLLLLFLLRIRPTRAQ